jgi:hypothetical protein
VLASWDVDELIEELRQALPGQDAAVDAASAQRFRALTTPRALVGFLLIGYAFGACSDSGDDDDVVECTLQSEVLINAIQSSDLSADDKNLVCSCITALDASWEQGLTQLFEQADEATIARALEEMAGCVCLDTAIKQGPYQTDFINGLCSTGTGGTGTGTTSTGTPTPIYKGVSFLDD